MGTDFNNVEVSAWGLLHWLYMQEDILHPEDRHLRNEAIDCGSVCQYDGREGEYVGIRFGDLRVRMKADRVTFIPWHVPAFRLGERVRVRPHRTARTGSVRCIVWHAKRGEYVYYLKGPGTCRKTRYFAGELERVEG
jgi:hypothetical protein